MVGHLIGAMKSNISMREMARQQLHGLRHKGDYGGQPMDAANALQVHEHRHLSPRQRLDALRELAPRTAHERAVTPALLRRFPIPLDAGGSLPSKPTTRLTLGWLNEILYTRDTWRAGRPAPRRAGGGKVAPGHRRPGPAFLRRRLPLVDHRAPARRGTARNLGPVLTPGPSRQRRVEVRRVMGPLDLGSISRDGTAPAGHALWGPPRQRRSHRRPTSLSS